MGLRAGPLVVPREGLQQPHLPSMSSPALCECEEVMGMQPKVLLPC